MGKTDTRNQIRDQQYDRARLRSQQDAYLNTQSTRSAEQYDLANQRGADVYGAYGQMYDTGGLNPEYVNWLRSTGQMPAGGGGVSSGGAGSAGVLGDPNARGTKDYFGDAYGSALGLSRTGGVDLSKINPVFGEFSQTGGYSPETLAELKGDIGNLRAYGQSGGLSADDINRMRGLGILDEFAVTGGYSPEDISNIRSRATSGVPALYGNLSDEMERRRAIQGGYSPGYGAGQRALTRDASRQMQDALLGTELGISDAVRTGRLGAIDRLTAAENALQQLKTGNQLRAMESALAGGMSLQEAINAARLAGTSGLLNAQQAVQTGKIAGMGGLTDIGGARTQRDLTLRQIEDAARNAAASRAASASAANAANARFYAGLDAENARYALGLQQGGTMAGAAGMGNVYGTNVNQAGGYNQAYLDAMLGGAGAQTQSYGVQAPLSAQPGVGTNIMRGVGAAAGLAAPFMGGGGFSAAQPYNTGVGNYYPRPA